MSECRYADKQLNYYSNSGINTLNYKSNVSLYVLILVTVLINVISYGYISEAFGQGSCKVYFSEELITKTIPLDKRLILKLNSAKVSIDAALYDLDSSPIASALIDAHKRNVNVRIVVENDNSDEDEIELLKQVGIVVKDDGDNRGLMHHKFFIIDGRYVWTGSYNTTFNGAYKNNNNVLWVDSEKLATNFTQEFSEMYVLNQYGKSSDKDIQFPLITLRDGTEIRTFFSPENDTITPLLNEIRSAKKSIHFMAFSFTHDKLGDAMREKYRQGIDVKGVFDESGINRYSEYMIMKKDGILVNVDRTRGAMHHKVIVIDEKTVITGSYNFSKSAETRNVENLLIIKGNKKIAQEYIDEFYRLKWPFSKR